MMLLAALLILGPTSLPVKSAVDYHRIEYWVPISGKRMKIAGDEELEWRCLQDKNQPSINYMVLSCVKARP